MSHVLPTGCKAIDMLLGGGVHAGMVTDVYGEGGSGKTQLCFTLCGRNTKLFQNIDDIAIVFVDTGGTFRPERITEIADDTGGDILDKILVVRALSFTDQIRSIERIVEINPRLLIVDGVASLFDIDHRGIARHLALMNHLHNLALVAVNLGCPVVITNMIRSVTNNIAGTFPSRQNHEHTASQNGREYMGASVSIYTHMRLMFGTMESDKHLFRAILKQPRSDRHAYYTITKKGISDIPSR